MSPRLLAAIMLVLLINLPFGAWREGVRRFSPAWFLAVHGPVPLVVTVRLLLALGWRAGTVPFLVGAYFGGQYVGGRLRRSWRAR